VADVASSISKMNDIEIAFQANLSEQLFTKMAANINGLIDRTSTFTFDLITATGTWTKPAGARKHIVIATGRGGSGGSCTGQSASGGGGAGGTAIKFYDSSALDATESVTINSTSTTFKGLTANVGANGTNSSPITTARPSSGGEGGTASGGDINIPGGMGGFGIIGYSNAFTPNEQSFNPIGGAGGASLWGGGATAGGGVLNNSNPSSVRNSSVYGAGGSGAARSTSGSTSGGTGGGGVVLVINLF
jgi:hypothetical protein